MTQAVGPQSRQQLLDAALAHFAEHGIGDQSLRQIAAALGTNHRKLIYHFGSKSGLLAAVVDTVERQQRRLLLDILGNPELTPQQAGEEFWRQLIGPVRAFGGFFFELSGQAIQGRPHAIALRDSLVAIWLEPLTQLGVRAGLPEQQAADWARLSLATARGLFFDLLITEDLAAIERARDLFTSGWSPPNL